MYKSIEEFLGITDHHLWNHIENHMTYNEQKQDWDLDFLGSILLQLNLILIKVINLQALLTHRLVCYFKGCDVVGYSSSNLPDDAYYNACKRCGCVESNYEGNSGYFFGQSVLYEAYKAWSYSVSLKRFLDKGEH